MSEFDRNNVYGAYNEETGLKAYITKVFTHMGIGLTICISNFSQCGNYTFIKRRM